MRESTIWIWKHSLVMALACGSSLAIQPNFADGAQQEHYELRIYRVKDAEKQKLVSDYLQHALLPALERLGITRVGVFTRLDDDTDFSVFMLIPFSDVKAFTALRSKLESDEVYRSAAAEYFARPLKDPAFERIESRFMKAFAGMPVIEPPSRSKQRGPRIFELRLYESHTEDAAARKVAMFNDGEIQLMRDVNMAPIFFGETLIGQDVPNLVYMLSADDMSSHKEHWKAFLSHPDWDRMKNMEKYKDTVSGIKNWFLKPTSYSEL